MARKVGICRNIAFQSSPYGQFFERTVIDRLSRVFRNVRKISDFKSDDGPELTFEASIEDIEYEFGCAFSPKGHVEVSASLRAFDKIGREVWENRQKTFRIEWELYWLKSLPNDAVGEKPGYDISKAISTMVDGWVEEILRVPNAAFNIGQSEQKISAIETRRASLKDGDDKNTEFTTVSSEGEMPVQQLVRKVSDIYFGNYHALIIGNNAYRSLPALKTAVNDANATADLLRNHYGFTVTLLTDATRADILRTLATLRGQMTDRDNLLIYYAGHGWLDKEAGRGYWWPVDAQENDPTNWIDNANITGAVRAMNAKHIMVVADSCYSGSLTRGIKVVVQSSDYIQRMTEKKARTVLTSGGLEPVADSGGGNHSAFAKAFLDVLRENKGVIDGHQLFTLIRRPVMVNSDQTPEYGDIRIAGHEGGDFLFVRKD